MRLKTAFTHLSTALLTASVLLAQSPSDGAAKRRKQPAAQGLSEQVNDAFGAAISALTYYPFMNIAQWFGLDTDPQLRKGEKGQPEAMAKVLAGTTEAIVGGVFAPDSNLVLTWDGKHVVRLYDVANAEVAVLGSFPHPGAVRSAAFYADSTEFATACADGKVRVFGASTAEGKTTWAQVFTNDAHRGEATRVGYSVDGGWLWSYGADSMLRLWGATQNDKNLELNVPNLAQVAIAQDTNEKEELVWVRDGGGSVQIHHANGTAIGPVAGLTARSLAITADGRHALVRIDDTGFRLLDAKGAKVADVTMDTTVVESSIEATKDGISIVLVDAKNKSKTFNGKGEETASGAVDPSGYTLSSDDRTPDTTVLKKVGSDLTWVLKNESALSGQMLSPDGNRAVTFGADGKAHVWEWFIRGPDGNPVATSIPFVVLWLVVAAVIFTIYMKFVNLRMFGHAIQVVRGKYSNPEDAGEVTHFQALSSALSATVGLGNIAGVAIAVSVGGPGATFWMIVAGLLGMTLKFTECTLGQKFRKIDASGSVSGGPMHYLKDGLSQKGLGILGWPLAAIFTVFCIGGSLAGGNAFQVNQAGSILQERVPFFADHPYVFGIILAAMVGVVIIGGIQRIAQTAEKIVPTMCGVYVLAALTILVMNIGAVPDAFGTIFSSALSGEAMYGGALGALIMGFRRAAFSNEAGVGSASIAHSAAKTPYAVREGIVALLEPFIDTVVVCTMTALVIVITGVYDAPEHAALISGNNGAALTSYAFATNEVLAGWFPWVLMVAVILFAFSTMISWSYYGERCWTNLFGPKSSLAFKIVFLIFTVLGSVVTATNVLEFGDVMILLMAFPNILGLYFLAPLVKKDLNEYSEKLGNNEFQTFK